MKNNNVYIGIAELEGKWIFKFMRIAQMFKKKKCLNLFTPISKKIYVVPHLHQHLLLSDFFFLIQSLFFPILDVKSHTVASEDC